MESMEKQKNRYITGFDGLRTLGVLGVIFYHLNPGLFVGGYLGVPIFLAISGYLVTDHMLSSYEKTGKYDNKGFYVRRLKRIYPQLITVLLATSAYLLIFQRDLLAKLWQVVTTNLLNVYNWWQIFNGQSYFERFAGNESPFTHLWTLSIEGQFYILWPIIIFLIVKFLKKKSTKLWFMLIVSVISAILMAVLFKPGVDTSRIYYGTDTRLYSIMLGAALAVVWPAQDLKVNIAKSDRRLLNILGTVSFAGMMFLTFSPMMNPQRAFTYQGGMFIFSLLTVLLIGVIAHPASFFNRLFTNPIFSWVGKRSFAIYLYQFPVMIAFDHFVKDLNAHPWLYGIAQIAIILLISEFTFRFIERPMGKMTWAKTKAYFKRVFTFGDNNSWKTKLGFGLATVIAVLGLVAVGISPNVKPAKADDSPLAQQIKKNEAANKKKNAELIKKAKEASKKAKSSKAEANKSDVLKEAEKTAKTAPVNAEFVPYGISQVDLQLAQNMSVTAIGDSVMAGSSNNLGLIFPNMIVDAGVSRQMINSFDIVASYKNKGALADTVLIGLGTNGPFTADDLAEMMETIGSDRHVFWINTRVPRDWQGAVNNLLTESSKKYSNLTIIDWYSYSNAHSDWFYDDQTHPNPEGSKWYSAFISKSIIENTKF